MRKLTSIEMEKTKGGFLIALFLGIIVGALVGYIVYDSVNDYDAPQGGVVHR